MAEDPVRVQITPPIDKILTDILTGVQSVVDRGERKSLGTESFSEVIQELKENTDALRKNTDALISAAARGGGAIAATGVSSSINAPTPQEGQPGGSSYRGSELTLPTWRKELYRGRLFSAAEEFVADRVFGANIEESEEEAGRRIARRQNVTLATSAALSALPAARLAYSRPYAEMQRSVDRRIGEPTQLGMLEGAPGPGAEGFTSSLGSMISSYFAVPSMGLTGGGRPGMIGNLFGANMSEATQQGWQSRYRAFTRGGINPFDMMSYQQALDINQGVASKGMRSLGEQISVEEALTDIVQSTAIDAGSALDIIDMSLKRLNIDASETKENLKEYGDLSKAAGKGVVEFTKEVTSTLNMITAGGAKGTQAQVVAETYSGIPQIEGTRVASLLGGSDLMGIQAAQLAASGNLTYDKAMAIASGFPLSGGSELDMLKASSDAVRTVVDQMMAGPAAGNERLAYSLAAGRLGSDWTPLDVEQIYKNMPKAIGQAETRVDVKEFVGKTKKELYGDKGRVARARSEEGMAALKNIKGFQGEGEGLQTDWFGMTARGGKDPLLKDKIDDLFYAMQSGDEKAIAEVEERWGKDNLEEARVAVERLLTIERGSADDPAVRKAWEELNRDIDITMGGGMSGTAPWTSTIRGGLTGSQGKELAAKQRDVIEQAFARKGISSQQRESLLKDVNKGMSLDEFENRITKITSQGRAREQQDRVEIALSEDAARWFRIMRPEPGSDQRDAPMRPGYNPRASSNP